MANGLLDTRPQMRRTGLLDRYDLWQQRSPIVNGLLGFLPVAGQGLAAADMTNELANQSYGGAALAGIGLLPGGAVVKNAILGGKKAKDGIRLFRAHSGDAANKIHKGSHFSTSEEVANQYATKEFNREGRKIRQVDIPDDSKVFEVGDASDRYVLGELARELGYKNPHQVGDDWYFAGDAWPWEESDEVLERLENLGYDFIRFIDNAPPGADAWRALRDIPLD